MERGPCIVGFEEIIQMAFIFIGEFFCCNVFFHNFDKFCSTYTQNINILKIMYLYLSRILQCSLTNIRGRVISLIIDTK